MKALTGISICILLGVIGFQAWMVSDYQKKYWGLQDTYHALVRKTDRSDCTAMLTNTNVSGLNITIDNLKELGFENLVGVDIWKLANFDKPLVFDLQSEKSGQIKMLKGTASFYVPYWQCVLPERQ